MTVKTCQNLSKTLFFVATKQEAQVLEALCGANVVVTGIGPVATTIEMIDTLTNSKEKWELLVQIGIAGAIDTKLKIGEVVVVESDSLADIGAWRKENNRFEQFNTKTYKSQNPTHLKTVTGQTVNIACNPLIKPSSQIETMEGAVFFQIAQKYNIKSLQIRTISNYTNQPRKDWKINPALENLQNELLKIF